MRGPQKSAYEKQLLQLLTSAFIRTETNRKANELAEAERCADYTRTLLR
jgi:hypothetical protein